MGIPVLTITPLDATLSAKGTLDLFALTLNGGLHSEPGRFIPENPLTTAIVRSQGEILSDSTALVRVAPGADSMADLAFCQIVVSAKAALDSVTRLNASGFAVSVPGMARFFGRLDPEDAPLTNGWLKALNDGDAEGLQIVLSEAEVCAFSGDRAEIEALLLSLLAYPPVTMPGFFEKHFLVTQLLLNALHTERTAEMAAGLKVSLDGLINLSTQTHDKTVYANLMRLIVLVSESLERGTRLDVLSGLFLKPPSEKLGEEGFVFYQLVLAGLRVDFAAEDVFADLIRRHHSSGEEVFRIMTLLQRHHENMNSRMLTLIAENLAVFLAHPEAGIRRLVRGHVRRLFDLFNDEQRVILSGEVLKQMVSCEVRTEIAVFFSRIFQDLSQSVQTTVFADLCAFISASDKDNDLRAALIKLEGDLFSHTQDKSFMAREVFKSLVKRQGAGDDGVFRGLAFVNRHADDLGGALTEISQFLAKELGFVPLESMGLSFVFARYCVARVVKTFSSSGGLFDMSLSFNERERVSREIWPDIREKMGAITQEHHQKILRVVQEEFLAEDQLAQRAYLYAYYVGREDLGEFERFVYTPDLRAYFAMDLGRPEALGKYEPLQITGFFVSDTFQTPNDADLKARIYGALNIQLPDVAAINAALPPEAQLVKIPGAVFKMGNDGSKLSNEGPEFTSVVSPFFVMEAPVSNNLYLQFDSTHNAGREFNGRDQGVVRISLNDAIAFAAWWNETHKVPGMKWRLQREAEKDLIMRDGEPDVVTDAPSHDRVNWGGKNRTLQVKDPKYRGKNGVYHYRGDRWELCEDKYGTYPTGVVINYKGASDGGDCVLRGGSWYSDDNGVRLACRCSFSPGYRYYDVGFRLVLAREDL